MILFGSQALGYSWHTFPVQYLPDEKVMQKNDVGLYVLPTVHSTKARLLGALGKLLSAISLVRLRWI